MSKIKDRLREGISYSRRQLDKLEKTLETIPVDLVAEAFPSGSWDEWWALEYEFTMPMDFALESTFKEFCTLQGYKISDCRRHLWGAKNAGDFFDVTGPDFTFKVAFRFRREGSTCVIKEIGKELKPIFEVVCSGGATEPIKEQIA